CLFSHAFRLQTCYSSAHWSHSPHTSGCYGDNSCKSLDLRIRQSCRSRLSRLVTGRRSGDHWNDRRRWNNYCRSSSHHNIQTKGNVCKESGQDNTRGASSQCQEWAGHGEESGFVTVVSLDPPTMGRVTNLPIR